jgi:hypothetical protein
VATRLRIGVLTLFDEVFADIGQLAGSTKRPYAERHGYVYIEETSSLNASRPTAWSKILAVKRHLPRFDWLFWTDADSLVTNPDVRLEAFLDTDHDLIVSRDPAEFSTGHFLIRNCAWSQTFLAEVWAQKEFIDHPWWEQGAVIHLMQQPRHRERLKILPKRAFNSHVDDHEDGDFILHVLYDKLPVRLRQMREWLEYGRVWPEA